MNFSLMYNYKIWLESLRAGLNTKILKRFSKKLIACELATTNAISAADIAFIMSSSKFAWLPSPLKCSPQKQNGWMLCLCFFGWGCVIKQLLNSVFARKIWKLSRPRACHYLPQLTHISVLIAQPRPVTFSCINNVRFCRLDMYDESLAVTIKQVKLHLFIP